MREPVTGKLQILEAWYGGHGEDGLAEDSG